MGIVTGAVAAYLLGCVPAARLASSLAAGRPGAPWVAGLADAAKGFMALWLFAPNGSVGQALTLTALVAGDQWPAMGREIGRSGQWALLGALAWVSPVGPPIWLAGWALGFVVSGYKAIGNALGTALVPPLLGFVAGGPIGWIALPGCIMVLERSREVIRRARDGAEPKHYWNSAS